MSRRIEMRTAHYGYLTVQLKPGTSTIAFGLAAAWHMARAAWWGWTDHTTAPPPIPVTFQRWTCGACGRTNAPWFRNCINCGRYLYFGKAKL